MKFLSHIRSRSGLKHETAAQAQVYKHTNATTKYGQPGSCPISKLTADDLEMILAYVCPHSEDFSYEALEHSTFDERCMLCDMRDLAECALVSRLWVKAVQRLLYETILYCENSGS